MEESEFDKFAEQYKELHQQAIKLSGEDAAFFAEYKVKDAAKYARDCGLTSKLSILDFGSGIGESLPYFMSNFDQCRLVSIDVSRKSLTTAKSRFGSVSDYIYFDGNTIPCGNNSFDLVFTACVFHHIPPAYHQKLLFEIYRVIKPGGLFIAFEHNPYNFLTVKTVRNCPFDDNAILIKGKDFKKLFYDTGFADVKICYRLFFPAKLHFLRPLENNISWIPFGAQYYVSGKKTKP